MAGDTNAGPGLLSQYYNNIDSTDLVLSRTDSNTAFDSVAESPDAAIAADTFSVRWFAPSLQTLGPRSPITPQDPSYEDDGTLRYDKYGLAFHHDPIEKLDSPPIEPSPSGPSGSPPINGSDVPVYHSNANFSKKLFLDFDGHIVSGTTWNNQNYNGSYNTGPAINAPAFSTDADVANFNTSELAAIQEIWAQVAEDFAPFQIDVTTEDPGSAVFTAGRQAIRALVSTDIDATTNQRWYNNAGGVAYLNSWTWTNSSPVWIFANRLGNGFAKYVAEAASHEVGHAFNLGHDGRISPSEAYYQGHGSGQTGWAPIMGNGYYRSFSQWSKGEYVSANNTQDDLAILNTALGTIADDHGNASATATQLAIGTNGAVASSGLIASRTDIDAFSFATQTGTITFNVAPFDFSTGKANLDVELLLLNDQGLVVASANNASTINSTLTTTLPKGFYTLIVDGVGKAAITGDEGYSDYASLGKYALSGTVVPNRNPVAVTDLETTGIGNSILIDVLLNDLDADQDSMRIVSVGAPNVGSSSIEAGKIRFVPPATFVGQATFVYTIADELGATATGSVSVNLIPNEPPTINANQNTVTGIEGSVISNSGTWADTDLPANSVSLTATLGTISKNSDGTWSWQIAAADQVPATNVIITATDGLGGSASVSFTYTATNVPPTLSRNLATATGDVFTTISNSGSYSDVVADTVDLFASIGNITKNANGTWDWSIIPSAAIANQSVNITAQDEDGGSSTVSFVFNAIPAVSNRKVYHKGSWFAEDGANVPAALDPFKVIAKSGASAQTLTYNNLVNTSRGLNGLVFDVAGLASTSLTANDFGLRMSPTGFYDESTNPPSGWTAAPAPTGVFVTAGTASNPARVRLEWPDNAIKNRWLQVRFFANPNTGLPNTEVYYIGHLQGEINGIVTAGAYMVNNADMTAVLPVGQDANIDNVRDIDKNGFVMNADRILVRDSLIVGDELKSITIPAAGSAAEGAGPGDSRFAFLAPTLQRVLNSDGKEIELQSTQDHSRGSHALVSKNFTAADSESQSRLSTLSGEGFQVAKASVVAHKDAIRQIDNVFSWLASDFFADQTI